MDPYSFAGDPNVVGDPWLVGLPAYLVETSTQKSTLIDQVFGSTANLSAGPVAQLDRASPS